MIGDAGLVFDEGNVDALARSLARVQRDGALRKELGMSGRERVASCYTMEQVARGTVGVYGVLAGDE